MAEDDRERRRQARKLIISGLRIVLIAADEGTVPPSELIRILSIMYKRYKSNDSAFRHLGYAADQVAWDEFSAEVRGE
jgi:hypothetical protein